MAGVFSPLLRSLSSQVLTPPHFLSLEQFAHQTARKSPPEARVVDEQAQLLSLRTRTTNEGSGMPPAPKALRQTST